MADGYRVFFIGGSSHAGKSTVAQALAERLGWAYVTTDHLARHPGRPWSTETYEVPDHVAAHYLSLSPNELIADVLRHYRSNVWPLVQDVVTARVMDPSTEPLVIEGSALLPECVATLALDGVGAVWLTANDTLLAQRIHASSRYETRSAREQEMIDRFLRRTWLYNARMVATAQRMGLTILDVEGASDTDELVSMCLAALTGQTP